MDELVEVGRASDPVDLATLGQFIRNGNGVGGFATAVEIDDGLIDGLVCGPVEVVPANDLNHIGDRVLGEHHAAEY
ncbi:hypothetical protein D3C73_1482860 [compost metagenome]